MAKKIKNKKKADPSEGKQGFIILLIGGIVLAAIVILLVVVGIIQLSSQPAESSEPGSTVSTVSSSSEVSSASHEIPDFLKSVEIDETKDYYATIDVKDYGTIKVKLDYNTAPITARNFIYLADSGFYNGLTFHRIMEGFMIQGGDPQGNGTGGSENTIFGEFSENGFENSLSHTKGVISMARNSFDMNSASSQFFIVQSDGNTDSLDGKYAAFGKVTEGLDVVDQIAEKAEPTDNNGTIPASQQPVINTVTITAEPKA